MGRRQPNTFLPGRCLFRFASAAAPLPNRKPSQEERLVSDAMPAPLLSISMQSHDSGGQLMDFTSAQGKRSALTVLQTEQKRKTAGGCQCLKPNNDFCWRSPSIADECRWTQSVQEGGAYHGCTNTAGADEKPALHFVVWTRLGQGSLHPINIYP